MTSPANPLIAARVDTTTAYSGLGIIESVDMLVAGVRSGSWVDTTLGTIGTVAEGAVWALDPFGALVASGFGWVVEHVEPLSDALDWLAGDPDQVAANGQTWRNVAAEQASVAELYAYAVNQQTGDWVGPAASAYRTRAGETTELLTALSHASTGMSTIVAATGSLVSLVRMMVRDLIGELVSILLVRLPLWTAETVGTLGIAGPYVVAQITSLVAKWGAKISRLLRALVNSLRNVLPVVRRLDELAATIAGLLRPRRPSTPRPQHPIPLRRSATDPHALRHSDVDPLRAHGPARLTHPGQFEVAINEAEALGVEVLFRDGTMAYAPGVSAGRPGQLILDPDASYGALIHEMSHLHDDAAAGWPGFAGWFDNVEKVCANEYRAYQREIDYAASIGDHAAAARLTEIRNSVIAKIRGEWMM